MHGDPEVDAVAHDLADHRAGLGARVRERLRVDATGRVELGGHHAQRAGHDDLARGHAAGELTADPRDAGLRGQHLDACGLHDLRDRPTGGHPDAAPGGPVQRDRVGIGTGAAHAAGDLAQQVVGRCVVGLPGVAEPTGHGAEPDGGADRHVAGRAHQVEPAVGLDAEDQLELRSLLLRQALADLQPSRVQQDVDAPMRLADLLHNRRDRLAVAQVDAVVVRRPASSSDRLDRCQGRRQTLEARQLPLDQDGRRLLAAGGDLLGQVRLHAVRVGQVALQLRVTGVRGGGEVQQVERATRGRARGRP